MNDRPYLSIVVTTRNDDHGGGITQRMMHCFNSLAEQAKRIELPIELVVVEWNPPPDRPPLAEAGLFPPMNPWLQGRVITVPADYHQALPNADKLPLFQYIAKNIGLRRARGTFVLCTNVDIILSTPLADFLGRRSLADGRVYLADRWDVEAAAIAPDIEEGRRQALFVERMTKAFLRYSNLSRAAIDEDCTDPSSLPALAAAAVRLDEIERHRTRAPYIWHMNACGDFTLMARSDWFSLRGYPEWPIHSWSLDSILLMRAGSRTMAESHIGHERPLYHIAHDAGWAATRFNVHGLSLTLSQIGTGQYRMGIAEHALPLLTPVDIMRIKTTFDQDPTLEYNTADWGAADILFPQAELP
jgi:hypothetical protein